MDVHQCKSLFHIINTRSSDVNNFGHKRKKSQSDFFKLNLVQIEPQSEQDQQHYYILVCAIS